MDTNTLPYLIDFDPVFLSLGPLSIHWYGITYLIAFACYLGLGTWFIKKGRSDWTTDELSDFMFYGALGVIIGGRLGWILFYNDTSLLSDPLLPFKLWEGGMSFHGGLIGVILAMIYFAKKSGKSFLNVADFVAPLVPLGIVSVRLGNFINGELWGRVTEHPWGMIFPATLPATLQQTAFESKEAWMSAYQAGQFNPFTRHPSPLYEAFGEGVLNFFMVWLAVFFAKRHGTISATFLLTYGVSRFAVEFIREPDANRGFIFFDWMTMGHILTLPLFIVAIALLVVNRNNFRNTHQKS